MRYRGSLTIPAGTSKSSAAKTTVPLTYGRINAVNIQFPPGLSGLVHCRVLYHTAQIFPTSPENDFIGDDDRLQFPDHFPVYDMPFEVVVEGWAPDALLSHTIYIDFSVEAEVPPQVVYSGSMALPQ